MARNDNKTRPSDFRPEAFLQTVEPESRRADCETLLAIFDRATGLAPRLWGDAIVGYGRYRYETGSGRRGEFFLTGFSPRKSALTLYVMPGFDASAPELARIGPHKLGKSCLYIKSLDKVDAAVLAAMIAHSVSEMRKRYETWDE